MCDDQEALIGSAQLIEDAISQMDGQVIEALTLHWDDDFKQAVLERFCLSDKKAVQTLAPRVLETKIKPEDLPVTL